MLKENHKCKGKLTVEQSPAGHRKPLPCSLHLHTTRQLKSLFSFAGPRSGACPVVCPSRREEASCL